ncbi:MAG: glycosyltransferase family 39 protein, partial [Magnetococcus sp. WYHC-3]
MKKRRATLHPAVITQKKQSGLWLVLKGRGLGSRLLFGALLISMLVVTRWAWIDCDGGTPSLNEYGFFATDEGYYCGGGKNQYLFDQFVNVLRASPNTYAICPALHAMTWGAFSIFGQTTWAHRLFPLLINTMAWVALFYFLSRRTLPWLAFTLCACCVLNPLLMVYGRTACNDTLMASVVALGYVLARNKGVLYPFLGGCVFGLGLWVKQSIWVLVALGLSGALTTRTPSDRIHRAVHFAAGFLLSALFSWGGIRLLLYGDAIEQGVTVSQLLALSNSSYPLPNIFDWSATLRGISAFPRVPTDGLLGIWVPLFLALPALMLLRRLTDAPFRWDARLVLYATLPLYAAGIMILPVYYAHYFIPVIAFVPVLWLEARRDLKLWCGRKNWIVWLLLAICLAYIVCTFRLFRITVDEAVGLEPFLASAFQLPHQLMWMANGMYILKAAILLVAIGLYLRQKKPAFLPAAGIILSAFGVADLCYALLPLSEGYPYCKVLKDTMKESALMLQVGAIIIFFVVWGMPMFFRRNLRWILLLVGLLLFGTMANPVWRNGVCELTKQNQLHKKAVAELAKIVPENGVVFGERAPQLFL